MNGTLNNISQFHLYKGGLSGSLFKGTGTILSMRISYFQQTE